MFIHDSTVLLPYSSSFTFPSTFPLPLVPTPRQNLFYLPVLHLFKKSVVSFLLYYLYCGNFNRFEYSIFILGNFVQWKKCLEKENTWSCLLSKFKFSQFNFLHICIALATFQQWQPDFQVTFSLLNCMSFNLFFLKLVLVIHCDIYKSSYNIW
jgi:hypothetical protein